MSWGWTRFWAGMSSCCASHKVQWSWQRVPLRCFPCFGSAVTQAGPCLQVAEGEELAKQQLPSAPSKALALFWLYGSPRTPGARPPEGSRKQPTVLDLL